MLLAAKSKLLTPRPTLLLTPLLPLKPRLTPLLPRPTLLPTRPLLPLTALLPPRPTPLPRLLTALLLPRPTLLLRRKPLLLPCKTRLLKSPSKPYGLLEIRERAVVARPRPFFVVGALFSSWPTPNAKRNGADDLRSLLESPVRRRGSSAA